MAPQVVYSFGIRGTLTSWPSSSRNADDTVIYKTRFSGFYKTDLDARLRDLDIKNLIVTGCTTSICVESTVRDAMFRDYLVRASRRLHERADWRRVASKYL